jgi:hypothetical protein
MVETAPTTAAENLAIFRPTIRPYHVMTNFIKGFLIICVTIVQRRDNPDSEVGCNSLSMGCPRRWYLGGHPLFVSGRVPGCDGFCDGSAFCKFFSINECDGVTGPDPWKASMPPFLSGIDREVIWPCRPSRPIRPMHCELPRNSFAPGRNRKQVCSGPQLMVQSPPCGQA